MSTLTWSDALALNQPQVDQTHREFVDLLAALERTDAGDTAAVQAALDHVIGHTRAHFAQEEAWMVQIGFDAENCHFKQHALVMQLLEEVGKRVREQGQTALVAQLVPALVEWFVPHARQMDAGLVEAMTLAGLDPVTGEIRHRGVPAAQAGAAAEAHEAQACGSGSCG